MTDVKPWMMMTFGAVLLSSLLVGPVIDAVLEKAEVFTFEAFTAPESR